MTTTSNEVAIKKMLEDIVNGKIKLEDFKKELEKIIAERQSREAKKKRKTK